MWNGVVPLCVRSFFRYQRFKDGGADTVTPASLGTVMEDPFYAAPEPTLFARGVVFVAGTQGLDGLTSGTGEEPATGPVSQWTRHVGLLDAQARRCGDARLQFEYVHGTKAHQSTPKHSHRTTVPRYLTTMNVVGCAAIIVGGNFVFTVATSVASFGVSGCVSTMRACMCAIASTDVFVFVWCGGRYFGRTDDSCEDEANEADGGGGGGGAAPVLGPQHRLRIMVAELTLCNVRDTETQEKNLDVIKNSSKLDVALRVVRYTALGVCAGCLITQRRSASHRQERPRDTVRACYGTR